MGKSKAPGPPSCQKYGVPLYGAAWAPRHIRSEPPTEPDRQAEDQVSGGESPESEEAIATEDYLVFAGGGGEGRSGIPNAVLLSKFDFACNSLPDQPVAKLGLGSDLPYRMAVHPKGEGIICALPNGCKWLEWDAVKCSDNYKMGLKSSEMVLTHLEGIGQQLAVTFNDDGSLLAVGGEDGKLRIFKWPSMEILLDQDGIYTAVKDLDFSPDGKFLASLGSGGPCRVWDVNTLAVAASLPREKDEVFGFCRFSQNKDNTLVLYTTVMRGQGGSIAIWNTTSWQKIGLMQIVRDPVSAFNVSDDGDLLAIGTVQGDISIIKSSRMQVQTLVRKAHLGLVTALAFSQDSRALVSASMDSSVRVTLMLEKEKIGGLNLWIMVFITLLAVLTYILRTKGLLP